MSDDLPTSLLERTLALLSACPLEGKQIAEATGLSRPWLSKLANGKIPNPGVKHIQTLHDFLIGLQ